jgi:hypothetical protein
MGQMYTARFDQVAVTALQDLFEIKAATSCVVVIHDWSIYQTSDVADAAEEILRIETVRGDSAEISGSGGSTVTPQKLGSLQAAAASTVEANNTTRMAGGSPPGSSDITGTFGWNVRVPLEKVYTPETRPVVGPGAYWALALPVAPADSLTIGGTLTFEEIG